MPPSKHYRTSSFKQVACLILNIPLLKYFAQNGFLIVSSVVDPGIEPRSCQTKDYKQQSLTLLISHFN